MINLREKNQVVRSLLHENGSHNLDEIQSANRIAVYAVATGEKLGLSDDNLLTLRYAAQLHNLGEIAARTELDTIEESDSNVSNGDTKLCEAHLRRILGSFEWLQDVIPILCSFHDRTNLIGVSDMKADQIPIEAQIIALCKAFDSSTFANETHSNVSEEAALARLRDEAETVFVPEIVEAFAAILPLIQPIDGYR